MTHKERLQLLETTRKKMEYNATKSLLYVQFIKDCMQFGEIYRAQIWQHAINRLTQENENLSDYAKTI